MLIELHRDADTLIAVVRMDPWRAARCRASQAAPHLHCCGCTNSHTKCAGRSCTGGKTEDFQAAARLLHRAGGRVVVPTFLVPATQKVWADVYGQPLADCGGLTAAEVCRPQYYDLKCEQQRMQYTLKKHRSALAWHCLSDTARAF